MAPPRDASATALWGLEFALSLCRSETDLLDWHGTNKQVFDLLSEQHRQILRETYRVKRDELKGKL